MSNNIERMLEISRKLEDKTASSTRNPTTQNAAYGGNGLDNMIQQYDAAVYGPPSTTYSEEEMGKYSVEKELERITKMKENGATSNLHLEGRGIPKSIVESIINNPLISEPPKDYKMEALTDRLSQSSGIKKAIEIMKTTDEIDKSTINEKVVNQPSQQPISSGGGIDYEMIKLLIENAIDKKLNTLNESKQGGGYAPSMKYLSFKDKFYFVDNDDNVFECEMKYKGKRKR